MKKKVFSLMMTLVLAFMGLAQAQVSFPYEYGFENNDLEAEGWSTVYTANTPGISSASAHTGTYSFRFSSYSSASSYDQYLISPEMNTTTAVTMKFWYRASSSYSTGEKFKVGYSTTNNQPSSFTFGEEVNATELDWTETVEYTFPAGTKYVAIYYYADYQYYLYVDDITLTTGGGGGGGGGGANQLHVKYMERGVEVIDELNLGVRPAGAWMEPFNFTMYTEGTTYTVNVLDFTPSDGMFTVSGEQLPFQVVRNNDVALNMVTNGTQAGLIERQFVAITEGDRSAHIWPVTVDLYAPEVPDVWEFACQEATTFPFVEVPATAHNTVLHNDYTLPFPEIPEGVDAVYKLVFTQDQMLNAEVTAGADGKVALYRAGFEGEGGPMATNYYAGAGNSGGGAAAAPFEAQIGDGTNTTGYLPMYYLYNYSLSQQLYTAAELAEAGATTAPMTSISWFSNSTYGYNIQNISIWMANVGDVAVNASSPLGSTMNLVYEGNFQEVVGWNEFVFNAGSFAWDGSSNVLVMVQMNNGSWSSSIQWESHNPGFQASAYVYQDNTPYSAQTTSYSMTTSSTTRANTLFKSAGRRTLPMLSTSTNNPGVNTNTNLNRDGWMFYDNGTYATNVGAGGDVYWGTMFPASMITENRLTKVALYENSNNTGNITLQVYSGGTTAPGTQIYTQNITPVGGDAFHEITLASPVTIDPSQNLWIVFHQVGDTYPATACEGSSYPNNRWVSQDGVEWYDLAEAGLPGYEWLIRAYLANNAPVPPGPGPDPTPTEVSYSAGPVIEGLPVTPGTYYLVASSTTPDFEVTINAENMPCPTVEEFAFAPQPADNEDGVEPASVTLRWMIPEYATGWRLIFGSTYHPEVGHPQTVIFPEDGSFTRNMANSYTVRNLWNNTNYFWRVEFNNDCCPEGVSSPIWGFTTHLNIPQNLTVVDETVFNDENITLNWNAVVDRTYRKYNVYRDGELIGHTTINNIGNTTYTDGPLAYNMAGYHYYVTAVYDEGESAPSNEVVVRVSGYGDVNGHVYEQDGNTGIANATVTMVGQDEFGVNHTYNFQTNGQGYYTGHIYAGVYNGQAACNGYQTIDAPVQGNPINIDYNNTTSPIDYILDENFDPVCTVVAQYYPDSTDINAPYVKVYWGCGLPGEEIIEPFETGDFSLFDWQLDGSYPWSITTNNPYEGTYCMVSGGAGVANVVSNMTVTVDIPADGLMSFFGKISCESSWDYGYFFIDGVQKGQYTGAGSWGEKKFDITQGTHTFQWRYTKDGSVNSNDDCFYVDYITFYKRPEPAQPGWHTYCESEFNNALGSNLTTTPSWAYEYPASFLNTNYAGWNITKVSLFSDNLYSAVGGNYTCRIYVGGNEPAAGTMVSTLTVDVPSNQNAWVDWDLTTPVTVTGTEPIWVVWTANSTVSNWPAGLCDDQNDYGNWWDGGSGWEHQTYGTWTMRHWFTNRSGRSVAVTNADNAPIAVVDNNPLSSKLRTYVKGETSNDIICANPNAAPGARLGHNNTRAFSHYRVYRTNCYNDGPYDLDNTVVLACELHDTLYIDVDWPDVAPGVYKWGVGCVYVGNRGEEIAGPIHWAQPVAGNRATLTYDFDNSTTQGWTTIDANNDGYDWVLGSQIGGIYLASGASLTGTGHNESNDMMCSGSYSNATSQAITPDNYLVSPQVALGGSISFWACAQDASYAAEHFAVAVSTTSNTSASAFTNVQEWTMTAKSAGIPSVGRGGQTRAQGNWYQYTVDLSAYSGDGYVAIRHFNCNDQFILNVDDITIVEGADGPGPGPGPNPPTPGTGGTQLVNFEDGQIPTGWVNDATYPWVVATPAYPGFNGTYCLMSGNSGIASSTSAMEATVTFVEAGSISFLGGCWGEGSTTIWDKCQFFIDGNEQFSYGALQSWNTYSFDVTAGTHTFLWSYTKDGSVNPEGDAFFIDDITFVGVPGNGGGGGLQEPRESEIVWSNCLDKDMYLGENEVDINVLLNSADSPEGILVSFTNLNEAEQELYPIADVVLDETGFYAWDTFRKGDYQLTITMDGYVTIQENVSIWEPTSLRYVMIEIIYGIDNLYVSRTGWAMWDGHGLPPTPGPGPGPGPGTGGDSFEFGFENGFEGWTTIDNDGDGLNWVNSVNSVSASGYDYTGLAHGGNYFVYSQSYIDYDGAYDADNYLVSPQKYSIVNGSTLSFWADNANDSYPDHFAIAIATVDNPGASDFVDVWSHSGAKSEGKAATRYAGDRYQNWRSHSVDLSAYAGQNVWIAFHHQDYDEYEIWIDDVTLTAGAKSNDRHLEYYKVMCESIDHEPIFNVDTPHNFCQVATDELVEGELYICKVAAVYSTGMSDYAECVWEYESCENYAGTVNGLDVNGTTVTWDYPNGGGGGGGQGGEGSNFTVDFEGGMPSGWNVIDGNNDGYTWCLTSAIPTTWEYYASLSLDWYHNGTNAICSGSYINGVGALNPDEYFVSPQVTLVAGSQLSFWAAATDESYAADHFGVFISDNGTSDWTSVQEWTLTAKKQGMAGGAASRDGRGQRLGTWYNYTVDLSSYAGQKYIAFRHFNCYDQYIMCLDDITLTAGSKSNRDVVALNGFVTDPGAMNNGADASWIKGSQSTYGPGCQQANGNRVGDSFTLTAATTINEIEVYGYQTGSSTTSTFTGLYAQIYDGNPMSGGQVVWGDENANIMTATAFTNCYRGSDGDATGTTRPIMSVTAGNLNIELAAGTYYLVYQLSGTGSSGPWGQPHAEPGIGNTGNGVQWLGSDNAWQAMTDTGAGTTYGCAMKITGNGGSGPTPPPASGDVLGAMVFLNGEWEAFVAAPTNTYTFDEPGQYCVRIVYNGTADLPSNNFYYAMSCEECEGDTPGTCEPGDPIHAEVLGATDQVRIWWGVEPAAPINEWLYYDDGAYATSIGTGSAVTVYWAMMVPAADMANYAGTNLTKVAVFEFLSSSEPMTVTIHLGGTNAPGTAYSTKTYTPSVDGDFEEVTLDTPVAIDGTQNLWIVCSQVGAHPAHACVDAGYPNNRWISLDGTAWDDVAELGAPGYGWMIRGFVTNQSKGMVENVAIELPAPVASTGTLSHTEVVSIAAPMAFMNRASIVKYNVYRSDEANGTYTQIGEVVEAGQTLYEYFDTPETAGTYYYQVKAVYDDGCESAPALAADDPTHNYVSAYVDAIGENSDMVALYPNPTKDNVTIEANGMSRITVVSVLGQVVFDTELNANVYTLNMSQFNAGMYMVRIYTESGVVVKRVTVMQ